MVEHESTLSSESNGTMKSDPYFRADRRRLLWGGACAAVGTVLWLAFAHPLVALVFIALAVALMVWLVPKVWRALRAIVNRAAGWLSGSTHRPSP